MGAPDFLSLELVRLRPREKWVNPGGGLTFVFVQSGAGRCSWRKGAQEVEPGDVLVFSDASGAGLKPTPERKLVFLFFSVSLEHLFPLMVWKEIPRVRDIAALFKHVTLYPASRMLAAKCQRVLREVPPELGLEHRAQLLQVVAAILSYEFKNAQPGSFGRSRLDGRRSEIFDKLSAAEILTLPVTQLARRFNCTRRHLNRLFHYRFGCSVTELRMEMRLLRAASLLRNPELGVFEAAQQCGFSHRGLFNACFKRRFGLTPSEWQVAAPRGESRRTKPIKTDLDWAGEQKAES